MDVHSHELLSIWEHPYDGLFQKDSLDIEEWSHR